MTAQDLLRVQEAMMRTDAQYLGDWVETMADALIEVAAKAVEDSKFWFGDWAEGDPLHDCSAGQVRRRYELAAMALGIL